MRKTRLLSLLFVLALTCGILFAVVSLQAGAETSGDIKYKIVDDHAVVTGLADGVETGQNITIPSEIDGYPVTEISSYAFYSWDTGYGTIAGVTLPDSMTKIGSYAFWMCPGLTEVVIPSSVTTIGKGIFESCTNMTAIYCEVAARPSTWETNWQGDYNYATVHWGYNPDYEYAITDGKATITKYVGAGGDVVIPDTLGGYPVTEIGTEAFYFGPRITSVVIPEGVTNIGDRAFWYCGYMTSVTIPDSVTNIGESAFAACTRLESITIPDGVTSIGNNAFGNCAMTSVIIPGTVKSVGSGAFGHCKLLKSVIISDGVEEIGGIAFYYCDSLTEIFIPKSVTSMKVAVFQECPLLTDIYCEAEVQPSGWIETYYPTAQYTWFDYCNAKIHWGYTCPHENREETILKEANAIKDGELEYTCLLCGEMGTEKIPATGTDSGYCGYSGENLTWAFDAATGTLTISGTGLMARYGVAAYGSPGWGIYKSYITKLVVEDGVTEIGDFAFSGCSALTIVELPETLFSIRERAFANTNIKNIRLSANIRNLGERAFYNCDNLTEAYLDFLGGTVWPSVFRGCTALTDIYCAAESMPEDWWATWLGDCTATVHWGYKAKENDLIFTGASLTLQESLTINFKIDAALFGEGGYEAPYVKFVLNGVETVVRTYSEQNGMYVFDFVNILPDQMSDTITATLYATQSGEIYEGETKEYGVVKYCYAVLEAYSDDQYAELRTLIVDLLNYGAATQLYTNYNVASLANAGLTDLQKSWGTATTRETTSVKNAQHNTIGNPSVKFVGVGLNLMESIAIRFTIDAETVDGLTVKLSCGGSMWSVTEFSKDSEGRYVFHAKLNAAYMSDPLVATVYQNGNAVSNSLCYSIESYANECVAYDQSKTLADLVGAMIRYGDSAKAYVN